MNAQQVSKWLKKYKHIKDIQPVRVTIAKLTYEGACYNVVTDGKKQPVIYLLGDKPKHRKAHNCYPYEGQEWFVAGYYSKDDKTEYHPFGQNFMLQPWCFEEKIDKHERWPYGRIKMMVELL